LKRNKKGSVLDIMLVTVILFAFVIVALISHLVFNEINDQVGSEFGEKGQEIMQGGQAVVNGLDTLFVIIIIGIVLFLVFSVFMIDSHPSFFFIALVLLVFAGIVGGILSDSYVEIKNTGSFDNETATYGIMDNVMTNYVKWIVVIGFLAAILVFAKMRWIGG